MNGSCLAWLLVLLLVAAPKVSAALLPQAILPYAGSLAISRDGQTLVIGSGGYTATSAAYVFVKPSQGWSSNQQPAAVLTDGVDDQFGSAVAISPDGSTIVVGSIGTHFQSPAYVFEKPSGGWTTTSHYNAKLTTGDLNQGGLSNLAIDQDTIVGTSLFGNGPGCAFVFAKPARGWHDATPTAVLLPSDQLVSDDFYAVAISRDTVVVGAYQLDTQQHLPGAAYVYIRPAFGWRSMTETAKLTSSDGQEFDSFGISVDVQDSTIVVGAYQANTGRLGKAYIFVKPSWGWASMTETAELTASDEQPDGRFGQAVAALSPSTVAIMADGDSQTYIYSEPAGGWQTTSQPTADIHPPQGYSLGGPIVGTRNTLIVSAARPEQSYTLIYGN